MNGVFHTAGVIDDGLIGLKSKAEAAAVLAPKIQGTLVLDRVLDAEHLDFLVLFSSTSALLGLEGQVDYTAANAFLDAYARYKYASDGTPTSALNWGAWQQVGMAARLAGTEVLPKNEASTFPHFDAQRQVQGVSEYTLRLSPQRDWLLGEHRTTAGVALLPGTSYLSFTHAAFSANTALFRPSEFRATTFRPAELRDVVFLQPFVVADHAEKSLQVRLEPTADLEGLEVTVSSGAAQEREHVRARVMPLDTDPQPYPMREALHRCPRQVDVAGTAEHEHMAFGDRWKNVRTIAYGEGEAVISLSLPERFVQDLDAYPLHPALLDMATGKAQALIPNFNPEQDFYVPLSYAQVQVFAPLQPTLYSHVRLVPGDTRETVSFDITLTDTNGVTLLNVERFTMKRVGSHAFDTLTESDEVGGLNPQQESVRLGIRPAEGLKALERVLAAPRYPQLVVSPQDFKVLMYNRTHKRTPVSVTETQTPETPVLTQARPNLATVYVEPQSETEKVIAELWQDTLGLAQVGVHDTFFELGGHSLLLTQVVTRVRKKLGRSLTLALAFEQPTIAQWIESLNASEKAPATRQVTRVARSAYRINPSELE